LWRRIGATLRRFHRAGICHADLNAHNVLIDGDGRVYVIDFDRGSVRDPAGRWTRANLARLRHSLEKVHATGAALYYTRDGWNELLNGYSRG
jgi:3-deoxy-D-manno-octulosonic acid kinase